MLVVISDLHLTDGTCGPTASGGAFHLLSERLTDLAASASTRSDDSYRPLDRIDLVVDVQPVAIADLTGAPDGEASAPVRARVLAARDRQLARPGRAARLNAALHGRAFERVSAIDEAGRRLLERSAERLHLTARGFHRVLKVARTIADLADERDIATEHLAEALQYRLLD